MEKAKASNTRMRRARPNARGRPTLLDKAAVNELRIVTLVGFADVMDTGIEIAGQSNKDKHEERETRKATASRDQNLPQSTK